MQKEEIVKVLEEIGVILEIKGENVFKTRAYVNGARALENLTEGFEELVARGELGTVPGIGKAIGEKIEVLWRTGELGYYEELKGSIHPGLLEMLRVPGVGPKKVKVLHEELGINTLKELEGACKGGEVSGIKGFGKKTQENILKGIENLEKYSKRFLWWRAHEVAEGILEGLRGLEGVERVEIAGSLRRCKETVGDLDFLVASGEAEGVMEYFIHMSGVEDVTARGETKSSVRLESGMQADLRVVPMEQFYYALHHFTGSKEHNVQMRQRALSRGYSLSEWGLVGTDGGGGLEAEDEEAIYRHLGLNYVPPELREGLGELEYMEGHEAPDLVRSVDIRGVFHNHTTESDGRDSLEVMARGAREMGWEYLGIADHSKSSFQANGLSEERLLGQVERIREYNALESRDVYIFAGSEVDILKDGCLDYRDEVLEQLDYVVASVHSSFQLSRGEMTARIVRAIEHPRVTMLGHLTGRLLLKREGYLVDYEKVIDAAVANRVIIELNANPMRLDMDWRYWRRAVEKGLMTSINPDAHGVEQLGYYRAGVNIARKGWLTGGSVLNTRSLKEVKGYLGVG